MTADTQGIDNRSVDNLLADVDKAREITPEEALAIVETWPDTRYQYVNQEWNRYDGSIKRRYRVGCFVRVYNDISGIGATVNEALLRLRKEYDEKMQRFAITARVEREIAESEVADRPTRAPG